MVRKTSGVAATMIAEALALHLGAPGVPLAADLAGRIQAHYDTVPDFRAGFSLTYTSGPLGETTLRRGDVKVKKPNRMDWAFTMPTKKRFVADGVRMLNYEPN